MSNTITNKYFGDSDRAIRMYLDRQFSEYGLGGNRFIFFVAIARNPGVSQAEICHITLFDKAIVARAVAKLEELDYVTRKYLDGNKRRSHLYLTEKGEQLFDKVANFVTDLNDQVASDMNMQPEELEALAKKYSEIVRAKCIDGRYYDSIG